jgi:hypothetical protein
MCTTRFNIRNYDLCLLSLFLWGSYDAYNELSLFLCTKLTAWSLQYLLCSHNCALNAKCVSFSEKDWKFVSFRLTLSWSWKDGNLLKLAYHIYCRFIDNLNLMSYTTDIIWITRQKDTCFSRRYLLIKIRPLTLKTCKLKSHVIHLINNHRNNVLVLVSRKYFSSSIVFIFILLVSEGRSGDKWVSSTKVMFFTLQIKFLTFKLRISHFPIVLLFLTSFYLVFRELTRKVARIQMYYSKFITLLTEPSINFFQVKECRRNFSTTVTSRALHAVVHAWKLSGFRLALSCGIFHTSTLSTHFTACSRNRSCYHYQAASSLLSAFQDLFLFSVSVLGLLHMTDMRIELRVNFAHVCCLSRQVMLCQSRAEQRWGCM